MVDFNKLKALGTEFLGRAEALAEQAKEKAGPLAEQAKEKAGPLAEKAKDAAVKGTHKAAETFDSRTGGKYSDKIDTVTGKVDTALRKDSSTGPVPGAPSYPPSTGAPFGSATDDAETSEPSTVDFAAGSTEGTATWTDPASVTDVDAGGTPVDPGWGEDPSNPGRA